MAIKIEIQSTIIPVEIGGVTYEVDMSDDATKVHEEALASMADLGEKIDKLEVDGKKEEANEAGVQILKTSYDDLLGEGAFDAIYKLSPSIILMMDYFLQITLGVSEEMTKRQLAEKKLKYLQK